jgi:chemotaxis protein methyltransferase CheR
MPCSEADYSFLRQFVFERSQNILDPLRNDLFDARLYRLLRERKMAGLDELVAKLQRGIDPALDQSVVEAMTINETSFFRDLPAFELLRVKLIPQLIEARASQRQLRFWSAACSSGQEAYSLAMLIRHHFPELVDWDIEILGTDIHSEMIRRARSGRYHRVEVNRGLPARFLLKFFVRHDEEWEIDLAIRAMCRFQTRNLSFALPAWEHFDLILLRNVLFYFSSPMQERLLENLQPALSPDGYLILGASEQVSRRALFQPFCEANVCYYTPQR